MDSVLSHLASGQGAVGAIVAGLIILCSLGAGLWLKLARLRFARHVFDNTRSTDALKGYNEQIKLEKPTINLPKRPSRQGRDEHEALPGP